MSSPEQTPHVATYPIPSIRGRSNFWMVGHVFSMSRNTAQFEFVDDFNPKKDTIVRRKAREWVFRNRELTKCRNSHRELNNEQEWELEKANKTAVLSPNPSPERIDSFDVLPNVGMKVDHIIEFYYHSSHLRFHILTAPIIFPRLQTEVSSPMDKHYLMHLSSSRKSKLGNAVLKVMASERISFIVWLLATTIIRDAVTGGQISPDARTYNLLAIQAIREESKKKIEDYSDHFFASLACLSACANFTGDYIAAKAHRDAMVRVLTLKGRGDLRRGIQQCESWTQKAITWCEIHVAAQVPQVPQVPYYPPPCKGMFPQNITLEAESLKSRTLAHLPSLPPAFERLILELHQLSLLQPKHAEGTTFRSVWPVYLETDPNGVHSLYRVEHMILRLLSVQEGGSQMFLPVEIMFLEACQLFLWSAIRGLPLEMKMCDLFVHRLQKAAMLVLHSINDPTLLSIGQPMDAVQGSSTILKQPRNNLDFVLIWALVLGTLVSGVGSRHQHAWFKEQLLQQILVKNAHIVRTVQDLKAVLKLFPYTDAFCGLGLTSLQIKF